MFPTSSPWQPSQRLGSRSPSGPGLSLRRGPSQSPSLPCRRGRGSQDEIKCLAKHKGRLPNTVRSSHWLSVHTVHAINLQPLSAHFTINASDSLSRKIVFILINSIFTSLSFILMFSNSACTFLGWSHKLYSINIRRNSKGLPNTHGQFLGKWNRDGSGQVEQEAPEWKAVGMSSIYKELLKQAPWCGRVWLLIHPFLGVTQFL